MAGKMLKIPYGKTDFGVIRREGYYYVDKTRFIRNIEDEGIFVFFLRPRRFGKSLMLAVLQAYYDVKYKDQFDTLFKGLDIYENPTPKHNTYLVMKFNFSGIDSRRENVLDSFNTTVLISLRRFIVDYKPYFAEGTLEKFDTYKKSDEALNYILSEAQGQHLHIYLMIDEYDNFANTLMASSEDDYKAVTHGVGAFRLFFNILKLATTGMDSPIDRMFITGVSPLTLSDVTSGFNIGNNFSLNPRYNEMVGFTEDEVRRMLEYYRDATGVFNHSVDELLEIMKPWYNNNCFSSACVKRQRMFNSDMTLFFIMRYVEWDGRLPEDMIDVNVRSDYNKMRKLVKIDKSYGENARIMQYIFENKCISGKIKPEFAIEDLLDPENLKSHLFYMGLLTYGLDRRNHPGFVIPNQVVYEQYYKYMSECYKKYLNWFSDQAAVNDLRETLVYDGDAKPLLDYLCGLVTTDSSNRDFDPQAESFIKGFLLAQLGGTNNSYLITETEREENHGFSDLYMEPWNEWCKHSFVIELKYCKHASTDEELKKKESEALDQLRQYTKDKKLLQRAQSNGWTLHQFVIVFRGWHCEICREL